MTYRLMEIIMETLQLLATEFRRESVIEGF